MSAAWVDDILEIAHSGHWDYGPSPLSSHPNIGPFTYFIQSGDTIKIGCSGEPEKRVDQLRRGGKALRPSADLNPEIRLLAYSVGGYEREAELHEQFANSHDCGEWFFITDELTALVDQVIAEQAHLEVELHDKWYQRATETHGWPPVTFDLEALTQKRILAITTDQDWQWMDAA